MANPTTEQPLRAELVLIRHAPIAEPGRLCGRTDLPARIDAGAISALAPALRPICARVVSPALRCRQTASAIWPNGAPPAQDDRLWEQAFGMHDGLPYGELPDLGVLSDAELAAHRAPGGESFDDLCARVTPALTAYALLALTQNAPVALVVHAGVIRAALAAALGIGPAALRFEIDPLSVTRLRVLDRTNWSVSCVNRTPAS